MRPFRVLVTSSLVAAGLSLGTAAAAPPVATPGPATTTTAAPVAGAYIPVSPFRAVDTRTGAMGNRRGAVPYNHGIAPTIGGHGTVPVHVAAVAVTITAVAPSAAGGLVAYQAGTGRPGVQNVRYTKGHSTAVSAIVRTSATGKIIIFNTAGAGRTHIVVDVSGYYVAGSPSAAEPGVLHTVTPARSFNTGSAAHALGAGKSVVVAVGGHGGVPSSGVGAVAVMISAVGPRRSGTLVAYPAGGSRPSEATVHFVGGVSYTQFAIVATDDRGRITIYNESAGAVQVLVDVAAYTRAGAVTMSGAHRAIDPSRIVNGSRVAANTSKSVPVAGQGGVPVHNVSAVVVSITVAGSARSGGVLTWQSGTPRPAVTNVQFRAGETVSNLAIVAVTRVGAISVRNQSRGPLSLYVDIVGYLPSQPATSTGRYVRNITATGGNDVTTMTNEGCEDAIQSRLVLLELGAQTVTAPLSSDNPGVLLSGQDQPQYRLSYDRLRETITGYLAGFASCAYGAAATIALGTNNDGDFDGPYSPAQRGSDWATELVAPLRAGAAADYPTLTVVGANDIEAGFASTEQQAEQWESAYLAADNTGDAVGALIYNGSADGCPTEFGATGQTCSEGWTQADYYQLAHGLSPLRIQVLPQIYTETLATQWANIDATGGPGLVFAGALSEYAACPTATSECPTASLPPIGAWTALVRALSRVVPSPDVPAVTDLRVDS